MPPIFEALRQLPPSFDAIGANHLSSEGWDQLQLTFEAWPPNDDPLKR